jgi:hypothetical protein
MNFLNTITASETQPTTTSSGSGLGQTLDIRG